MDKGYLQIRIPVLMSELKIEVVFFIELLCDYMRQFKTDKVYPSEKTMAYVLGISDRTIRRIKKESNSLNIVKWTHQLHPYSSNDSCLYEVDEKILAQFCPTLLGKNVLSVDEKCPMRGTNMSVNKYFNKDSLIKSFNKATQTSCEARNSVSDSKTDRERFFQQSPEPSASRAHKGKDIQHYDALFTKHQRDGKSPSVKDTKEYWKALLINNGYVNLPQRSFTKEEVRMLRNLIKSLGLNAWRLLEYSLRNWNELKSKIVWSDSGKTRLPINPTFKNIYFAHEDILIVMDKKTLPRRRKNEERKITVTDPSQIPEDHPEREKWIARLKHLGTIELDGNY